MLLIDVGNTNIKIYKDGTIKSFRADIDFEFPKERIYYISVNSKLSNILKNLDNAIDIEPMIDLQSDYKGLGADRKVVCKALYDGIIVDAGSAITVDVMEKGVHKGGFILPGVESFRQSFANISDRLDYELDKSIDLNKLPKDTKEALSFATFGSVKCLIDSVKDDKKMILTGGDGELFLRFFKDSVYKKDLIFDGMREVIGC